MFYVDREECASLSVPLALRCCCSPNLQRQTMSDYLEVLLALVQASPTVHSMATYLSEGVLLHPELSRYTPS